MGPTAIAATKVGRNRPCGSATGTRRGGWMLTVLAAMVVALAACGDDQPRALPTATSFTDKGHFPSVTSDETRASRPQTDDSPRQTGLENEAGFPFNVSPFGPEGVKFADFASLKDAVSLAASANKLSVTLYDGSAAGGDWALYFSGRSVAAVAKDFTILERVGTLTSAGADSLVKQAASDPPGSPFVKRADLDSTIPCILTSGTGSFDLTCGGTANVIVDFVLPPLAQQAAVDQTLTRLQGVARAVLKTGVEVGGTG